MIMALASMSLDGASDAEERRAIHAVASDERRRERRGAARVSSGAPTGERRARGLQSRSSSEKKSTALGGAKRTSMR